MPKEFREEPQGLFPLAILVLGSGSVDLLTVLIPEQIAYLIPYRTVECISISYALSLAISEVGPVRLGLLS